MPSSSSSLLATCLYRAIGTTPSRWARLRMLRASTPPASARSTAARRTRSWLRGARARASTARCVSISTSLLPSVRRTPRLRLPGWTAYTKPVGREQEARLQAITYHKYGSPDVLELEKVDPPAVGDDQVLVRVRAASVNPRDWHYLRGLPYIMRPIGLRIPRDGAFGSDVAGHVEAVGRAVTRFRPGDEVYAHVLAGAFAEQASVPEASLGPKPANLSFEEAAAVPLAALTALQGVRDPRTRPTGAAGPGHRRLGRRRQLRRAARQVARGGGHRRVQRRQRRPGPLARRRPRHRLHPGGLRLGRPALRPHLPAGRDPLAVGLPARPHLQGDAAGQQRRRRRPLDRARRLGPRGGGAVAARGPAAGPLRGQAEGQGPGDPDPAHRGRRRLAGDRPHLPAARDGRGHPLPGAGPRPRQRRHHRAVTTTRPVMPSWTVQR